MEANRFVLINLFSLSSSLVPTGVSQSSSAQSMAASTAKDIVVFSPNSDGELVSLLNRLHELNPNLYREQPAQLASVIKEKGRYTLLSKMTDEFLAARVLLLLAINQLASSVIPMANFGVKPGQSVCTDLLRDLRELLLWRVKELTWKSAMSLTEVFMTS